MLWLPLLIACSTPTPDSEPVAEPLSAEPRAPRTFRNAVVIVIDTLRADAVERAQTPHLDGIATSGGAAQQAWSAGTWTLPSTVSLFTGMHVRQHGWNLETGQAGSYPSLPSAPTLPEVLHKHGFVTEGLYANNFVSAELGFDRGFDRYSKVPDAQMVSRFGDQVKRWAPTERHFAYLHLLGPHSPLKPSPEAAQRWEVGPEWTQLHALGLLIGEAKRNQNPVCATRTATPTTRSSKTPMSAWVSSSTRSASTGTTP